MATLCFGHELFDASTNRYAIAHVYDATGAEVAGSPVQLTRGTFGYYFYNGPMQEPSSPCYFTQVIVYEDAGLTIQDPTEAAGTDCAQLTQVPGSALYPWFQAVDGATERYVRAHVFDATGAEISGSPVNLRHVALGLYIESGTLTMPDSPFVSIVCLPYTDSGHTTLDPVNSSQILRVGRALLSTDPGAVNVRSGTNYYFGGQLIQGTNKGVVLPARVQLQLAGACYDGNGPLAATVSDAVTPGYRLAGRIARSNNLGAFAGVMR